MPDAIQGYEARADEAARLANLTEDEILRAQLLTLRQQYLATAERLRALDKERNSSD